jgi:hypothetical protein
VNSSGNRTSSFSAISAITPISPLVIFAENILHFIYI